MTTTLQPTTNQTTTSNRVKSSNRMKSIAERLFIFSTVVVIVVVWQLLVRVLDVSSYLVPAPTDIASSLRTGLVPGPDSYWDDIRSTLTVMLLGFIIAVVLATLMGWAMAQWGLLESVAIPYVFAFQVVPMIAITPLIVLWVGFGIKSLVIVAAVTAYFPMLINALAGFKSVPSEQSTMFRGLCASRTQTFFKLKLPAASPMLLAGIDLALVYALLGAIVGEFVSGTSGLGVQILVFNNSVDIASEFAVLLILGCIAALFHSILAAVRRRFLFWTPSEIARVSS